MLRCSKQASVYVTIGLNFVNETWSRTRDRRICHTRDISLVIFECGHSSKIETNGMKIKRIDETKGGYNYYTEYYISPSRHSINQTFLPFVLIKRSFYNFYNDSTLRSSVSKAYNYNK